MIAIRKNYILILISLLLSLFIPLKNSVSFADQSNDQNKDYLQNNAYILGPGDVLELVILGQPELSKTLNILIDGNIQLPLIGQLNVDGLTIDQARLSIEDFYKTELLSPKVLLSLKIPRSINVSIVGQVTFPGIYTFNRQKLSKEIYQGEEMLKIETSEFPTLVNAIQKAGGITEEANLNDVILKRILPGKKRSYKKARLNILNVIYKGDHSQNPYLYDGDIIKINKSINSNETIAFNQLSNLASKSIKVYVVGEVVNPGKKILDINSSLKNAILASGGPINGRSNFGNIQIYRVNEKGQIINNKYSLDFNKKISKKENPILKNNDIVRVRRNQLATASDGLKLITEPFGGLLPVISILNLLD